MTRPTPDPLEGPRALTYGCAFGALLWGGLGVILLLLFGDPLP